MKTVSFFTVLFAIWVSTLSFAAGIGSTVDSIRKEYGNKVVVDVDVFGNPPRAGIIQGNAKYFGVLPDTNPPESEFYYRIKKLFPPDARFVKAYKQNKPWIKYLYVFKSDSLKKTPDIKTSYKYDKQYFNYPAGTFFMIVNHDPFAGTEVTSFIISLGLPGEPDISGMKKINKNPFK